MAPKNMFLLLVNISWSICSCIQRSSRQARLDTSGDLIDCWNALLELSSFSNEIVIFFLNGQADIGPNCCRATGIITRNSWPAMLPSLGFTTEEGNILSSYCDASPVPVAVSPIASSPVSG